MRISHLPGAQLWEARPLRGRLRNWGFEKLFSRAFVYNILFEDTEVDERFLGVDEDSTVLAISGAGCGVANHLSRNPRSVDAVDINPHHLALSALKASAAQYLSSHDELYALFGRGWHPDPKTAVGPLVADLPKWIREYWKKHHRMFRRSAVQAGMTAQMLRSFRLASGIDTEWLRDRIAETVAERQRAVEEALGPVFANPVVKALVHSPLQLVALGINFSQRDRILETEEEVKDMVGFLHLYMKRIAATDIERNWFVWYAAAGHYNHELEDAVPPYLRPDHFETSKDADTAMRYHHANLFDVLEDASPNTWSHYTLCDATDWMSDDVQKRLFAEILRTSRDGARVLYRSVEDDSLVERHGLDRHFRLDDEASRLATELDRTRQYRRVNFYTVCH